MRKIFGVLLLSILHLTAKGFELSPSAYISLLTCTPGSESYNAYGHSALRVADPENRMDLVYNYGTFNSRIDNFGWKFARGQVDYSLEIEPFNRFYANYDYFDRSIYEQVFDLDQAQKQQIFDFLNENAREENKYYRYDFIFNNCSSKIRDIIAELTGVDFPTERTDLSFREMIDHYNQDGEWTDLGIDLVLGARIDRNARGFETMFLPDYLMQEFDDASLNGKPLVAKKSMILDHGYHLYADSGWMERIRPAALFWIILAVFLLVKIYTKPSAFPPVLSVFFLTVIGLAGWFLLFMWLGTAHDATKWNLNVLWAFPLNFPLAFFLLAKKPPRWVIGYFYFVRVLLITLLFVWPLLPQQFHIAVLPMMLTAILAISANMPARIAGYGRT